MSYKHFIQNKITKNIIKWSSALFILTIAFSGTANLQGSKVLALSDSELVEKLDKIFFFGIYDKQNNERAKYENRELYFVSEDDAKKALANIHNKNPESSESIYIVRYSLEILRNKYNILYVPDLEEVDIAETISKASQQPYQGGVPVFVGKVNNNYLVLSGDNSPEIIPVFFRKQHLDSFAAKFTAQNQEFADEIETEVLSLKDLIKLLEDSDESVVKKIRLIPYYTEL